MKCKNKNLLFLSLIFLIYLGGCQKSFDRHDKINHLKEDLNYLASDLLEGRETGSEGAQKAADYIAGRFEDIGLDPKEHQLTLMKFQQVSEKKYIGPWLQRKKFLVCHFLIKQSISPFE